MELRSYNTAILHIQSTQIRSIKTMINGRHTNITRTIDQWKWLVAFDIHM